MSLKKKVFIGLGILVGIFVILQLLFGKSSTTISTSDNAVRLASGGNLVKSNILSDPSVLDASLNQTQSCPVKFPKTWDYVDSNTALPQGDFNLWFTTHTNDQLVISHAKSSNGFVWNEVTEGVLKPSGWNKIGVETANVLKGPDGKYRMYYSSSLREHDDFAIGFATSDDGKNWSKHTDKPIFEPANSWEQGSSNGVMEPSVIYDKEDRLYKMWYSALGEKDGKLAFRIGYATSADGINWNRRTEPVLDAGTGSNWDNVLVSHSDVVETSQGFHMFYFGVKEWCEGCGMQVGAIGHAFSKDGQTWEKNPNNPIIKPRAGLWDAWTVGGPSAMVKNGKIWLWYFGNSSKNSFEGRIGLVSASCN